MAATANPATAGGRSSVRVAVVGDPGTGKSSLILAVATESFPDNVPHVISPTHLPADYFSDPVPMTIIDTSASMENTAELVIEVQRADAILLTYACDGPTTIERLSSYWLPELRRLEVKVPVIIAGCKLDLRGEQQFSDQLMLPVMQQFPEIQTFMECSLLCQNEVADVFRRAQKEALHPTAVLEALQDNADDNLLLQQSPPDNPGSEAVPPSPVPHVGNSGRSLNPQQRARARKLAWARAQAEAAAAAADQGPRRALNSYERRQDSKSVRGMFQRWDLWEAKLKEAARAAKTAANRARRARRKALQQQEEEEEGGGGAAEAAEEAEEEKAAEAGSGSDD